jgi:hypothetical protein
MLALSMGLIALAYTGGLWAYCLLRGYNITVGELFSSTWPSAKAAG